jgi:S-adenosylmethionine decarboxylase
MNSAGTHLIMDGFVADASSFEAGRLKSLFYGLTDALQMTMLREPEFIEVELDEAQLHETEDSGVFHDEGGITGFCIISTSHISIHCWPLRGFFSLDVFSCKDFDAERAAELIEKNLDVSRVRKVVIQREVP